ncbi:MAG TPA: hypothetical protein VMS17_29010 [Gemmataceae bacterium]|nr:hypothetical protein [Gemmataceae bacterium]
MNGLLGDFWFLFFASITITAIACALAFAWLMVRRVEAATALKQAMLARGLSVDEMERLLRPAADERLVGGLAEWLGMVDASGETIKAVLEAFQAADPSTKRLLYRAIVAVGGAAEGKPCDEQILGVVRGLFRPDGAAAGIGRNPEPKLAQTAPKSSGQWDPQGIRAEQVPAGDRPRE